MALDEGTIKHLENVKKGKPRHFVMICKGVKIVSLILYKKGTVEKYKKQAKEEGKGQFFHGVVDGKGENIAFNLLRSDGFDKPPGKELVLKDFLNTETEMKFKPVYQIVDVLPEVGAGEEDDTTNLGGTDGTTAPSSESELRPPPPPPVDPNAFIERLRTLAPELKKAQALETSVSPDLKLRVSEAQTYARKKDYMQASLQLDLVEELISQAIAEAAQRLEVPPPPPPPPPSPAAEVEFASRLQAIRPDLKRAQEAGGPRLERLNTLTAEVQELAKAKNFAEAIQRLDQLELLIQEAPGDLTNTPASHDEETTKVKNAFAKLAPNIKAAAGKFPEHKERLTGLVSRIQAGLKSGDVDSAKAALRESAAFLKGLSQPPQYGFSLFKLSKARVEWLSTRDSAISDMRALKDAISERFVGNPAVAQPLSAAMATLDDVIRQVDSTIHEDLDAVLNADDTARPSLIERVRAEIEQLLIFLGTNPVMQAIDYNEVIPSMLVRDPLEAKLNHIAAALGFDETS